MIIARKTVIQQPLSKLNSIDNNSDKIKLFYTYRNPNTDIIF